MSGASEQKPSMIDMHVGLRLRVRRLSLHLSIADFARVAGQNARTVEAWERGDKRITATELYGLAHSLEVPVAYFYDGLEKGGLSAASVSGDLSHAVAAQAGAINDAQSRELLNFYFDQLSDELRRQLIDTARVFATAERTHRPAAEQPKRACS